VIWVIQQWQAKPGVGETASMGLWENVRHPDGMPMMYSRKCEAQIALRALPRGRYRITSVRD